MSVLFFSFIIFIIIIIIIIVVVIIIIIIIIIIFLIAMHYCYYDNLLNHLAIPLSLQHKYNLNIKVKRQKTNTVSQ